jgi:hypothetical protein
MFTVEPDVALFIAFWMLRQGAEVLVPVLASLPAVET